MTQLQAKCRECCDLWCRSVYDAQISVELEQRIVESENLGNFFVMLGLMHDYRLRLILAV